MMNWDFLNDIRDRLRRKVKPVRYIDFETRSKCDLDRDILYMAYKKGDEPVKILKINS
jgi:hypothetical protein